MKLYCKIIHVLIRRSLVMVVPSSCKAWELPLLQMKYGDGNITVLAEEWKQMNFSEGVPAPAEEYDRMQNAYGKDESGVPYAVIVYGQSFQIHNSLQPLMQDCLRNDAPAVLYKQITNLDESGDKQAEIDELKRENEELKRLLGAENNLDENGNPVVKGNEGVDDDENDPTVITDPDLVPLPETIDANGNGNATKDECVRALIALGSEPDDEMSAKDIKDYLKEVLCVEFEENGIEYDKEAGLVDLYNQYYQLQQEPESE